MSRVCIITARGGSKRIPKKNIKEFCGKPIIAYSIEAALESGLFDEVMVSTDSEEIAEVAKRFGAKVPFMRSAETSNDYATTRDVLLEVLSEYEKRGRTFDTMVCVYPTAPFISAKRLVEANEVFEKKAANRLVPVVRFSFPPQRGYVIEEDELKFKWPEYMNARSQDLEPFYHDAGQFYFYRVSDYLEKDGMQSSKVVSLELSDMEVQDIDNEDDWKIAEFKYSYFHK
jgi:N-acylneuraminate cytidylyltransferase